MSSTQKLVYFSFFITLASVLGLLEAFLPNPFPLPGVKLGLANIVTLLVIYLFGTKEGLAIAFLRVLFVSFLSGTFLSVGFFLSLSGATVSALVMAALKKYIPSLSIIGISIAGAVTHNIAQLLAASVLIQTGYIFFYLPVLLLASLPTGLSTGYMARLLLPYLQNRL
ncbi:MAG: heptaprenyl diphosphate synthase [Firmicutes bacterium HGW-Firmicutes-12]|jgi:heptaprenyl diphosphate synthase|nr:MAG: heptaprenyl diphosphate synthase [Firmicutes bacterium HGW-Firmicutes-12]